MNKLITLIILSILFFSCNNIQNSKQPNISFKKIDSINLKIPNYFDGAKGKPQMSYLANKDYLYFLIKQNQIKTNKIIYYNLKTNKLKDSILLPMEGPENYNKLTGIHVKSEDSIFVFSYHNSSFFLINKEGKLLKTYKFKDNQFTGISSVIWRPIFIKNDDMYFFKRLPPIYNKKEAKKVELFYKYNLKTMSIKKLDKHIPDSFINSPYFNTEDLTFTFNNKDKVIVSSPFDDNIWIYNLNSNKNYTLNAKSIKSTNNFEIVNDDNDMIYEYLNKARYTFIVYDKYRKVYYRFYYPGNNNIKKNDENNMFLAMNIDKFSVVILDTTFNKIGEIFMPEKTYNLHNYFVSKKGLNINSNNELSNNFDENSTKFNTLILNEKK